MQSAQVASNNPNASSFGIFSFAVDSSSSQPSGSRFSKNGCSPRLAYGSSRSGSVNEIGSAPARASQARS